MFAGRRTHLDPILSFIEDNMDSDSELGYYFWEGQGQIYQDFGDNDRVMVSSYMGTDDLNIGFGSDLNFNVSWGNRTYSSRWRHIFSPKLFSRFKVASSNFFVNMLMETKTGDEEDNSSFKFTNYIQDYSFSNNYEYFYSNDLSFNTGVEFKYFKTLYESKYQDSTLIKMNPDAKLNTTMFFETSKTWDNVFTVKPGVRIAYNDDLMDGYKFLLSPRLSLKYMLTDKSSITLSGGRYYQNLFTVQDENNPIQLINQWFSIDSSVKPGISDNFVFGYELSKNIFEDKYIFKAETYYKTMKNLLTWKNKKFGDNMVISEAFDRGDAYSYGVELSIEKIIGKLNGSVSYTYSKVRKNRENDTFGEFNPYWDSPHNFKSNLSYRWNKNFNFGATLNFSSGKPYTIVEGFYVITQSNGMNFVHKIPGEFNGGRYPNYFRLDVAANYSWFYSNGSKLLLNLSVLNLTDYENVQSYIFQEKENANGEVFLERNVFPMFPLIPSIRLSYSF